MSKAASIFKTFFLSLCIVANTHLAFGQTASILPQGYTQYLDNNGKPLSAGKVFNYIPNTTTPKTTWQDAGETIPNANPVILDAGGRAKILGDGNYRQIVKDRNNVTIWDAVTSSTGSGSSGPTSTGDGDLVGTIKPWAGMTAPNQYLFTYGQEVSRTTYSALLTAITSTQSVFCSSGSPTLTGLSDTTNFWIGMSVEVSCVLTGASTIISKTSSSVTLAANANTSTNTTATFFPWGRGNGATTFNLPDFRGVIPAGNNNMGGVASSNLTTTYFPTNPNSVGAFAGSQSKLLSNTNIPTMGSYNSEIFNVSVTSINSDIIRAPLSSRDPAGGAAQVPGFTASQAITSQGSVAINVVPSLTRNSGGAAGSATIAAAGSGYSNGTQVITVVGGVCTTQPQFNVTVAGNVFTGTPSLLTAGNCSIAPTNPAATTGGGGTGGTLSVVYTGVAFSLIQPTRTTNFIIKVTPDANSASASGVTSLGGMTGDIACGSGLLCTGNIISVSLPSSSEIVFPNLAAATAATITGVPDTVRTLGYTTPGDNGGATYIRISPATPAAWRFQSADGQWWALNNRIVTPEMFACKGDSVTDDTACWQSIASYLNLSAPTAVTINNRPGAIYKIWPVGIPAPNMMVLDGINGLTWNWSGSRFQTDNLFPGVGGATAVTFSDSLNVIINDPWYVQTSWSGTLTLNDGTFFRINDNGTPWSKKFIINNLTMNGGTGAFVCGTTSEAGGYATGFTLNNMQVENTYYGINTQSNCDNLVATIKGNTNARIYFPWNVSNHRVQIEANGGTTNDNVLLKTYALPAADEDKRGLRNIDVKYLNRGRVNASASSSLIHTGFQQWVPEITVSGAANNGSGFVRLTVNSTADVTSGKTWFFNSIGGTTEANGKHTVTVVDATHLDLDVAFTNAYTSGGYGRVPASMTDIKIQADVEFTFTGQPPLSVWSKYNFDATVDNTVSGYTINNYQFSGSARNYTSGSIFEFLTGPSSVGTWTNETIKNAVIRDLVLTGAGTASATAPTGTTLMVENVYSDNTIPWSLGGTLSNYRIVNVYANGFTNKNTVIPSTAPANQFTNGIDSNGGIAYAQVNFSNLAGTATYAQIQNAGALCILGRSVNSIGVIGDICTTSGSNAVLRENAAGVVGFGPIAAGAIANGIVTYAKFQNLGALSLMGRASNSSGVGADISAAAGSGCIYRESGSTLGCGTVTTNTPMYFGTAFSNVNNGQTRYYDQNSNDATENLIQFPAGQAMTLRNFYARASAAPGGGGANSWTYRVRKNGVNSAIICTITDPATTCADLSNTETYTATDLISVQVVASATVTAGVTHHMAITARTTSP